MSEVENAAPSNGAGETPAVVETPAAAPAEVVQEAPAKSAREAVERAMAKVDKPAEATEAKPEVKPDATGRVHGPDGKFVAKDGEKKPEAEAKPAEPEKPKRPAPARFSKDAHPHWDTTPEPIQAEVERAINELTQGIDKYKTGHEAYEQLKQYDEMARKSGTTLVSALQNYTAIENLLRSDPVSGTLRVWQNMGIQPAAMIQHLQQIASGQQPMPVQQQQPAPQPVDIEAIVEQKLEQHKLQQEIAQFSSDPARPFFELLRPVMAQIMGSGEAQTLSTAYDAALSKHPQLKAASEAQAAADAAKAELEKLKGLQRPDPVQTQKKAALSVTGSPSAGSNPTGKPAGSAREALERAAAQVGLN